MEKKYFAEKIIEWYRENKRFLPWRETTDPYKIWISEIILQQTRVAQGLPYYLRFTGQFPDVEHLAAAPEQEVLRLWQGLGYYSRARNLHRCAREVVANHHGLFPARFEELQKLPGIGPYTAAAIASIAFREPVAVVDGNVFRVLARHFGIEDDITTPSAKKYFFDLANKLMPAGLPDEFNQAMMEFGALHCTPQNPKCDSCVLANSCTAFARGWQARLPVKTKKTKAKKRYLSYFVICRNKDIAMQRRDGRDIWQGLYDFYCIESSRSQSIAKIHEQVEKIREICGSSEVGKPSRPFKHILTHQILYARFIPVVLKGKNRVSHLHDGKELTFYSPAEVHDLPKPVLVSRYLEEAGYL